MKVSNNQNIQNVNNLQSANFDPISGENPKIGDKPVEAHKADELPPLQPQPENKRIEERHVEQLPQGKGTAKRELNLDLANIRLDLKSVDGGLNSVGEAKPKEPEAKAAEAPKDKEPTFEYEDYKNMLGKVNDGVIKRSLTGGGKTLVKANHGNWFTRNVFFWRKSMGYNSAADNQKLRNDFFKSIKSRFGFAESPAVLNEIKTKLKLGTVGANDALTRETLNEVVAYAEKKAIETLDILQDFYRGEVPGKKGVFEIGRSKDTVMRVKKGEYLKNPVFNKMFTADDVALLRTYLSVDRAGERSQSMTRITQGMMAAYEAGDELKLKASALRLHRELNEIKGLLSDFDNQIAAARQGAPGLDGNPLFEKGKIKELLVRLIGGGVSNFEIPSKNLKENVKVQNPFSHEMKNVTKFFDVPMDDLQKYYAGCMKAYCRYDVNQDGNNPRKPLESLKLFKNFGALLLKNVEFFQKKTGEIGEKFRNESTHVDSGLREDFFRTAGEEVKKSVEDFFKDKCYSESFLESYQAKNKKTEGFFTINNESVEVGAEKDIRDMIDGLQGKIRDSVKLSRLMGREGDRLDLSSLLEFGQDNHGAGPGSFLHQNQWTETTIGNFKKGLCEAFKKQVMASTDEKDARLKEALETLESRQAGKKDLLLGVMTELTEKLNAFVLEKINDIDKARNAENLFPDMESMREKLGLKDVSQGLKNFANAISEEYKKALAEDVGKCLKQLGTEDLGSEQIQETLAKLTELPKRHYDAAIGKINGFVKREKEFNAKSSGIQQNLRAGMCDTVESPENPKVDSTNKEKLLGLRVFMQILDDYDFQKLVGVDDQLGNPDSLLGKLAGIRDKLVKEEGRNYAAQGGQWNEKEAVVRLREAFMKGIKKVQNGYEFWHEDHKVVKLEGFDKILGKFNLDKIDAYVANKAAYLDTRDEIVKLRDEILAAVEGKDDGQKFVTNLLYAWQSQQTDVQIRNEGLAMRESMALLLGIQSNAGYGGKFVMNDLLNGIKGTFDQYMDACNKTFELAKKPETSSKLGPQFENVKKNMEKMAADMKQFIGSIRIQDASKGKVVVTPHAGDIFTKPLFATLNSYVERKSLAKDTLGYVDDLFTKMKIPKKIAYKNESGEKTGVVEEQFTLEKFLQKNNLAPNLKKGLTTDNPAFRIQGVWIDEVIGDIRKELGAYLKQDGEYGNLDAKSGHKVLKERIGERVQKGAVDANKVCDNSFTRNITVRGVAAALKKRIVAQQASYSSTKAEYERQQKEAGVATYEHVKLIKNAETGLQTCKKMEKLLDLLNVPTDVLMGEANPTEEQKMVMRFVENRIKASIAAASRPSQNQSVGRIWNFETDREKVINDVVNELEQFAWALVSRTMDSDVEGQSVVRDAFDTLVKTRKGPKGEKLNDEQLKQFNQRLDDLLPLSQRYVTQKVKFTPLHMGLFSGGTSNIVAAEIRALKDEGKKGEATEENAEVLFMEKLMRTVFGQKTVDDEYMKSALVEYCKKSDAYCTACVNGERPNMDGFSYIVTKEMEPVVDGLIDEKLKKSILELDPSRIEEEKKWDGWRNNLKATAVNKLRTGISEVLKGQVGKEAALGELGKNEKLIDDIVENMLKETRKERFEQGVRLSKDRPFTVMREEDKNVPGKFHYNCPGFRQNKEQEEVDCIAKKCDAVIETLKADMGAITSKLEAFIADQLTLSGDKRTKGSLDIAIGENLKCSDSEVRALIVAETAKLLQSGKTGGKEGGVIDGVVERVEQELARRGLTRVARYRAELERSGEKAQFEKAKQDLINELFGKIDTAIAGELFYNGKPYSLTEDDKNVIGGTISEVFDRMLDWKIEKLARDGRHYSKADLIGAMQEVMNKAFGVASENVANAFLRLLQDAHKFNDEHMRNEVQDKGTLAQPKSVSVPTQDSRWLSPSSMSTAFQAYMPDFFQKCIFRGAGSELRSFYSEFLDRNPGENGSALGPHAANDMDKTGTWFLKDDTYLDIVFDKTLEIGVDKPNAGVNHVIGSLKGF